MDANSEEIVFEAALALPPEKRAVYLDQACANDAQLRQRIEGLIQAHERAGAFMAQPAVPQPGPTVRVSVPLTEKPGDKIGHYKLLQQVGEGGCGVVYMAEQQEPIKRRVAFKVIKLGMDTKAVIARFEAERQALALMDHPNIARVFDAGATETGRPYFVMELVRGIKITEYCDQNNLSTEARLDLFIQVCHAIQHAHQKGIIHRDIKPSNILVTINDGVPVPKVIDFGIAKATGGQQLTDKTLFTAFEQFIGTPAYMSPEQAEMTSLDIDTRSDIYALGVLLYELLTGHTPFDPKTLLSAGLDEMRRIIREQEPPRPSTRLSTLDNAEQTTVAKRHHTEPPKLIHQVRGDLDWIVMKCLEKDRTRRYETANGLAMDVEQHLNHQPVTAVAPSALYRAGKFARRHKWGLAAAGALLGLLVLGAVVSAWQAVRATRAEGRARVEAAKSGQVARFLKDMLEGVGPSAAVGRDATMLREILDKTATRVGKDLSSQPEAQAELRYTLGETYFALGELEKAEAMHREALATRQQLFGREHRDVAASMNGLAMALWRQHRSSDAERLLREALAIQRRVLGTSHPEVATTMNNLASAIYRNPTKRSEAETLLREALAMQRKLLGNGHPDVGRTLDSLSLVLNWEGKDAAVCEALCREALAIRKQALGNEHPDVAITLNWLGNLLEGCGKLEEAEAAVREALAIRRKVYSQYHPDLANTLLTLGWILEEEGKLAEAEIAHRETLSIRRKAFGADHPAVTVALANLLGVQCSRYLETANLPAAVEAERQQLEMLLQSGAGGHTSALYDGLWMLATSAFPEVRDSRRAIAEAEKAAQATQRKVPNCLNILAAAYAEAGDFAKAVSAQQEAIALVSDAASKRGLASRLRLYESSTPYHDHVALAEWANGLLAAGKFAEAEAPARECLTMRQIQAPDGWLTFFARSLLGGSLLGQKKYAEAEPLLLVGYEGMRQRSDKIPAGRKQRLQEALQRLVQLYEATGRPEQAAKCKQSLAALAQSHPATNSLPSPANSANTNSTGRTP